MPAVGERQAAQAASTMSLQAETPAQSGVVGLGVLHISGGERQGTGSCEPWRHVKQRGCLGFLEVLAESPDLRAPNHTPKQVTPKVEPLT